MMNGRALGRLIWRPKSILAAYPFLFAFVWPFVFPGGTNDQWAGIWSQSSLESILWIESVVLMITVGAMLEAAARTALSPLFAFSVPTLRASILREKLAVGVVVALLLSVGAAASGNTNSAPGLFGCAMAFFSLGSLMADPDTGRGFRFTAIIVGLAASFNPGRISSFFVSAPAVAIAGSLMIAGVILFREMSVATARRNALSDAGPDELIPGNWIWHNASAGQSERSLSSPLPMGGRLIDWLKAADFETFGERRLGWIKTLVMSVALFCGMAYVLGNPSFAGVMGLMSLSRGHRLSGRWPYPLSRASRSNVTFAASLVDNFSYFLLALIVMALLERTGIPRLKGFEPNAASHVRDIAFLPMAFIWAPLVQWLGATRPGSAKNFTKSAVWSFRYLLHSLAALFLAFFTWFGSRRLGSLTSPLDVVIVGISLGIVVQSVYWLALRRHFAKADLV